jgi:acetyl-CoA synthetase (ADP-forming)
MAEKTGAAGFLVSKMARPGVECIAGVVRDPQFGPTVMFGLGGLFVELYRDVSFSLAPLSHEEGLKMIRSIKGRAVLAGVRGKPGVDEDALAEIIVAVGRLAAAREDIIEIDLNPVIAYPDGALAVDARILIKA